MQTFFKFYGEYKKYSPFMQSCGMIYMSIKFLNTTQEGLYGTEQ